MDNHSEQQPTVDLTSTKYPNLTALVHGMVSGRISEWPLLKTEARAILAAVEPAAFANTPPSNEQLLYENSILRELLWVAHGAGYGDDGELQNNQCHPHIDFRRDSAVLIRDKILRRNAEYAGRVHLGPVSVDLIEAYHRAFSDDRNRQTIHRVQKEA